MIRNWLPWIAMLSLALLLPVASSRAAPDRSTQPVRRARPPQWQNVPQGIFYENAFRDAELQRPTSTGRTDDRQQAPAANTATDPAASDRVRWSELITAEVLEDELKQIKLAVDRNVTTPGRFKAGGFQLARQQFSMAATVLAIVSQYDGSVRWQQSATWVRDLFARAAANAQVGTQQTYNEARQRKADLQDLVNGARLDDRAAETTLDWGFLVDRHLLMRRLEQAERERLVPAVGAENFAQQSALLQHEAQWVAALAQLLMMPGVPDADDPRYEEYAQQLKAAALQVRQAVDQRDPAAAREAVGQISRTCTACHEDYRG